MSDFDIRESVENMHFLEALQDLYEKRLLVTYIRSSPTTLWGQDFPDSRVEMLQPLSSDVGCKAHPPPAVAPATPRQQNLFSYCSIVTLTRCCRVKSKINVPTFLRLSKPSERKMHTRKIQNRHKQLISVELLLTLLVRSDRWSSRSSHAAGAIASRI